MSGKGYIKLFSLDGTKINLMIASVYLTAYELVKTAIIEQLKNFYFVPINDAAMKQKYRQEVRSLHQSEFIASCLWLKDMGAITSEDIDEILRIREHRNKVAHELPSFLVDDAVNINTTYINKMHKLLTKIDVWWFMQVELPTNPDLSSHIEEITAVKSGPMLIMERLMSLLSLDQEPSEEE